MVTVRLTSSRNGSSASPGQRDATTMSRCGMDPSRKMHEQCPGPVIPGVLASGPVVPGAPDTFALLVVLDRVVEFRFKIIQGVVHGQLLPDLELQLKARGSR